MVVFASLRGSTPVPALLHVLLRVFPVLRCRGRWGGCQALRPDDRTLAMQVRQALRSRRPYIASQALSDAAFGRRPLPRHLRTPRTAEACMGPKARKTLRQPHYPPGFKATGGFVVAGDFQGLSRLSGMRRRPGNERLPRRRLPQQPSTSVKKH